ncbi:MAG: hypothetical protein JST75_09430 [Bacteroidetes bacterium]|nr:hypothetical protein [Bacteroidota bacterium]
MKKIVFPLLAVSLAIIAFSFTRKVKISSSNKPLVTVYFVYKGSGSQNNAANYTQQSAQPATCPGATNLCWFKVQNGTTFAATFSALDVNHDGVITSADGAEDHLNLELKI